MINIDEEYNTIIPAEIELVNRNVDELVNGIPNTNENICNQDFNEILINVNEIVNEVSGIPNTNGRVCNQDCNETLMENIIPNDLEEFVSNNAGLIEASQNLFREISINEGDMSRRKHQTKWKFKPSINDIESINKICFYLFRESNGFNTDDVTQKLWLLNCATYTSIVTWSLNNKIKLQEVTNNGNKENRRKPNNNNPKWLQRLENEIAETRKLLSQCVNERDRIQNGGRLTRKLKRNRNLIEVKCNGISVYNLTVLIKKLKSSLRYKAKKRGKKLKAMKTRRLNKIFIKSPGDIYKLFEDVIKEDDDNVEPKFSEIETKDRKYFSDIEEVETFWKGLWTLTDQGKPGEEWLNEIESIFIESVPLINEDGTIISDEEVHNGIRKKRNWSSAGPDRIVNFWWKYLKIPLTITQSIFNIIVNYTHKVPRWYCRGRTPLIEKDVEWSYQNQRPITCLNTHYKWLTSILLNKTNTHLKEYNMLQIDQ